MRCSICRRRYARGTGCPQHGQPEGEQATAAAIIPGLALGAMLGRGGFSTVWAAEHAGRPAAVKIGHRGTDAAYQRTAREAAALDRLGGVHAPALYDRGEAGGRPYLVMARVRGVVLEQLLEHDAASGGAAGALEELPARTALGAAIAEVVAAVHAAGVVHGDLKPENIALDADRVTLIDLGSAAVDGAAAPLGASVEYMAPELWRGGAAGEASDVYALGAIVYELVTGHPPFVGETRTVEYHHLMLRPALAGLPAGIAGIVGRCLAKDPAQRPTAAAAGEALRACVSRGGPPGAGREPGAQAIARRTVASGAAGARRARPSGDIATAAARTSVRTCALVIADVRAEAPAVARIFERHTGELLYVRGARFVAAWTGTHGQPAARAVASARELHRDHGARAVVGIERIACDPDTEALRPARANLEPAWLPPQWRGVIGTAQLAALLDPPADAPGGFVDLTIERAARDPAPLVGRARELELARASFRRFVDAGRSRALTIVGAPGMGKSHLARQLATELAASRLSGRELGVAELDALGDAPAAIVIDDADAASDAVLERLERRAAARPRWLALVGGPALPGRLGRLLDAMPHDLIELGPLDDAAAADLVEAALAVERIPETLMRRLAALGEGRPRRLVDLATHLQRTGAVRRREDLDRRYVAADAVTLPDDGLDDWLAEAALAALPAELRAVAAASALLEPGFELAELEAVIDQVAGAADPAVGLVELATRGVAVAAGATWRLASSALARCARRTIAEPRAIAAAALELGDRSWTGQLDERRRRALARYAAGSGDRPRAARLLLALAEDCQRAHRDDEAEADFTAALAEGLPDAGRCAALLGRGVVHYRLDRALDALPDLEEAARLAGELADPATQLRAHVERATALDWLGRYDESARACNEAVRLAGSEGAPEAAVRAIHTALGRGAVRAGRYRDARAHLERAIELEGPDPGDDRLLARMLLGPTLVQLGALDEAERVFADAIAAAERIGDGLARCAVLGNRVMLWSARGHLEHAHADLDATCELARRFGNAVLERGTTLNLAEQLYWHGQLAEAARLAERSCELQRRLVGHAIEDEVLLARIAAARGELDDARAALARAATGDRAWPVVNRILRDAVAAFLDHRQGESRAESRLAALEAEAHQHLIGDELVEVLAWRFAIEPAPELLDRVHRLGAGLQRWRFDR